MKKPGFLLIILSLTIIFSACPPLLEDYEGGSDGDVISFEKPFELDVYKWFEILDKIAKDGKFVTLDLSKATLKDDNKGGGLVKLEDFDPYNPFSVLSSPLTAIAFDPFPASSSGKDFIISIILPDSAQIIKGAKLVSDITDIGNNEEKIEDAKKYSAFRSFSNLRSVKANNVTYIGNFTFADCKALTEVYFPRVSDTESFADIGKYAFLGCTGIKEIKFNLAAVIGEYAFKGCTSLSKIDFPEVNTIEKNAFEGCASLVNVFFEKTVNIYNEAFKGCTGLKKAEFNAAPLSPPGSIFDGDPDHPVLPDLDAAIPDFSDIEPSVIFYPSVFNGCKALEVLNVRNAWNVQFGKDVLANTGSVIDIYLFDEPSTDLTSYGHLQNAKFLGDGATVTLKEINIYAPINNGKIQGNYSTFNDKSSIAKYIRATYTNIDVNINKR
jgi:hypothetical protein